MRITQFPIQFTDQGSIKLSSDKGAELDLLLLSPPNSRTFLKDYGLEMSYLQQASVDPKTYIPVFSLELREKLKRFTRNVALVRAKIFKLPEKPRVLYIEIFWQEELSEKSKTFELNTK